MLEDHDLTPAESRVLEAIKGGANHLFRIRMRTGLLDRQTDKALQKLRKAGYIKYTGQMDGAGWKVCRWRRGVFKIASEGKSEGEVNHSVRSGLISPDGLFAIDDRLFDFVVTHVPTGLKFDGEFEIEEKARRFCEHIGKHRKDWEGGEFGVGFGLPLDHPLMVKRQKQVGAALAAVGMKLKTDDGKEEK